MLGLFPSLSRLRVRGMNIVNPLSHLSRSCSSGTVPSNGDESEKSDSKVPQPTNLGEDEPAESGVSEKGGEVAEFKEKTKDFSEMSFFEREHIIFPPAQAERPREYEVAPVDRDGRIIEKKEYGPIRQLFEPDIEVYRSPTKFFRILFVLIGVSFTLLVYFWDDIQKHRFDKQVHKLHMLLGKEDYNGVVDLANSMLKSHRNDCPQASYYKGMALFMLGLWADSIKDFQKAIESGICPMAVRSSSLVYSGVAFSELNQFQEADIVNTEALHINPHSNMAWRSRAEIMAGLNRYDEALEAVEYAIFTDPESLYPRTMKAKFLMKMNRPKEAIPVIQELKRHDPFTSSYCGLLAIAYLESGDKKRALIEIEDALVLEPANPSLLEKKGRILTALRRHDEARECFEQVVFLKPGDRNSVRQFDESVLNSRKWFGVF